MPVPNRRIRRAQKKALSTMGTIELAMALGMDRMIRLFLERVIEQATAVPVIEGGEASSPYPISAPDILTLGEIAGWWEDTLNADLALLVFDIWRDIQKEMRIQETGMQAALDYTLAVRDRLVQGLTPSLPEDAFNKIRMGLAEGALRGYSTEQLSQRIAADLSWETNAPYWREVKAGIDSQIDAILDPYGSPGNAVREAARLYDSKVQALRSMRNLAITNLDREKSYWQVRAERIARTESTGIYNAVVYQNMMDAEKVAKMWIATEDHRTRPSHSEANNQIVRIFDHFIVGGSALLMPGDPRGPAGEVINCRCTMIGLDAKELAELNDSGALYGFDMDDVEIPEFFLEMQPSTVTVSIEGVGYPNGNRRSGRDAGADQRLHEDVEQLGVDDRSRGRGATDQRRGMAQDDRSSTPVGRDLEEFYNKHHGSDGRFTSGPGGGGFNTSLKLVTGKKIKAKEFAAPAEAVARWGDDVSREPMYLLKPGQGEQFREAMERAVEANPLGAQVEVKDVASYNAEGAQLLLSKDGNFGGAVMPDGDIVSLFKHPDAPKGVARAVIARQIALGGTHADAYDPVLPRLYAPEGLVPVARIPFNDAFAPEGWDYDRLGRPDVTLMAVLPERIGTTYVPGEGPKFDDWDAAAAHRDQVMGRSASHDGD